MGLLWTLLTTFCVPPLRSLPFEKKCVLFSPPLPLPFDVKLITIGQLQRHLWAENCPFKVRHMDWVTLNNRPKREVESWNSREWYSAPLTCTVLGFRTIGQFFLLQGAPLLKLVRNMQNNRIKVENWGKLRKILAKW